MENVVETMDRSRRDHSTPRLRISSRIDRSRNARRRRRPPDHGKLVERGFRCAATVVSSRDESARDRRLVKYRRNVRSLRIVKKCALIPAAIFRTILYTSRTRVLSRLVPRSNRIGEASPSWNTYQNVDGYLCRRFRQSHHGHHVYRCCAAREEDADGEPEGQRGEQKVEHEQQPAQPVPRRDLGRLEEQLSE